MSSILLLSSLLKVRLAPRGARLASNAGESPHSSAISIVQEPLPSTWREGRRNGDEMHILHASNSASSPREKKSEDFSEGPLFFLRGPGRSAKAPSSGKRRILHSRKQKASPSAKKNAQTCALAVYRPPNPPARVAGFAVAAGESLWNNAGRLPTLACDRALWPPPSSLLRLAARLFIPPLRPTCSVATIGAKRATKSKAAPTAERRQTATARKANERRPRAPSFCHAGSPSGIGGFHGNRKRRSGRRAKPRGDGSEPAGG